MISGGGANVYARNYLRCDPTMDYMQVRRVKADPDKSYRCTQTVAIVGDHECRVNSVTHEVYDRCRGMLRYVGISADDVTADIAAWRAWLVRSGGAS